MVLFHPGHDIRASVAVNEDFSFYGGVNNIGDKRGDVASDGYPYGTIGRVLYVGARIGLGRLF